MWAVWPSVCYRYSSSITLHHCILHRNRCAPTYFFSVFICSSKQVAKLSTRDVDCLFYDRCRRRHRWHHWQSLSLERQFTPFQAIQHQVQETTMDTCSYLVLGQRILCVGTLVHRAAINTIVTRCPVIARAGIPMRSHENKNKKFNRILVNAKLQLIADDDILRHNRGSVCMHEADDYIKLKLNWTARSQRAERCCTFVYSYVKLGE